MLVSPVVFQALTRLLAKPIKPILLAFMPLALLACATAPVQEMSDARQAIYSAEAAGAAQRAPDALRAAQRLLAEAQKRLAAGNYDEARQYALEARDAAIQSREQAARNTLPRPAP